MELNAGSGKLAPRSRSFRKFFVNFSMFSDIFENFRMCSGLFECVRTLPEIFGFFEICLNDFDDFDYFVLFTLGAYYYAEIRVEGIIISGLTTQRLY